TGLFWTGKRGLELGLVDALGDMRTVLKTRFGPKTQLRLVSAPRGFLGRFGLFGSNKGFSAPDIAAAAASSVIDAAEERALWARFGL
ncbi:MAG: S49 family peptidase, partial [Mesorhizobium sp.]